MYVSGKSRKCMRMEWPVKLTEEIEVVRLRLVKGIKIWCFWDARKYESGGMAGCWLLVKLELLISNLIYFSHISMGKKQPFMLLRYMMRRKAKQNNSKCQWTIVAFALSREIATRTRHTALIQSADSMVGPLTPKLRTWDDVSRNCSIDSSFKVR